MITITKRVALVAPLALAACRRRDEADIAAIEDLMHATWDRPAAPLNVGPLAIDSDYAIADWTQGAMGGRALLRKHDAQWHVVLCAGDGLRDQEGLVSLGLPSEQARRLADRLIEQERVVDSSRLAAMSRFAGIVRMDEH